MKGVYHNATCNRIYREYGIHRATFLAVFYSMNRFRRTIDTKPRLHLSFLCRISFAWDRACRSVLTSSILLHYFLVYSRASFLPGSMINYYKSAKMHFWWCVLIAALSLIKTVMTLRLADLTYLRSRTSPFRLTRRISRQCRQQLLYRFMQTSLQFYVMTVRQDGSESDAICEPSVPFKNSRKRALEECFSWSSDFLCRMLNNSC